MTGRQANRHIDDSTHLVPNQSDIFVFAIIVLDFTYIIIADQLRKKWQS